MESFKPSISSGYQLCKELCELKLTESEFKQLKARAKPPPYFVNVKTMLIGKLIESKSKASDGYFIHYFSTYFEVSSKEIDLDSGDVRISIRYFNGLEIAESTFSSDIFTKFGTKELFSKGIRFNERDAQLVLDYLLISEQQAKTKKSYTKHRFLYEQGQLKFLYNRLIGDKDNEDFFVYRGIMDLQPAGSLKSWLDMVKSEVIGNPALEFVLLSSFASSILAALNLQFDFGCIMIHLANSSSKGKTTAAMLAASVWSNPLLNRGTAISYNATENALTDFVSNCNGLCVVLDESSVNQTPNLQKLLYEITLGRSKMRLNGDSTQKAVKEFSSIIISTSEVNFIEEDTLNGIKARVFEVTDRLTKSAENSDRIKNVTIQNYALAGEPFLEYLTSLGLNSIVHDFEQTKNNLHSFYNDFNFSSVDKTLVPRIISKLAIILLARDYFEKVFGVSFNSKKLLEYVLNLTEKIELSPTLDKRIVNLVASDVTENGNKYHDYQQALALIDSVSPIYGLIRESHEEGYHEVCVLDKHFDKLIRYSGVSKTEANRSLRNLRKNRILIAQPDRLRTRISLSRNRPESMYYVFKFKNNNIG